MTLDVLVLCILLSTDLSNSCRYWPRAGPAWEGGVHTDPSAPPALEQLTHLLDEGDDELAHKGSGVLRPGRVQQVQSQSHNVG